MKTTILRVLEKPKLTQPVLIEGLPGMGYVGKLAAEHILSQFRGKVIAELYSPHFPHHVSIGAGGIMRPLRNEIYHVQVDGRDLLIWVGDVQSATPEGHYEIVERVLDFVWEMKTQHLFTLGGFATGRYTPEKPKVIALGDIDLVREAEAYGAISSEITGGPIIGAAGLLIAKGRLRGMKGLCLLGETHGMMVDPRAAKEVLEILMGVLKLKISMQNLEEKARATEQLMEKLKKEMERRAREEEKRAGEETPYIG
ncbi:MAG: proteasome assembly chaperone family protein [Candidatus Hadarchaeales archaeon]